MSDKHATILFDDKPNDTQLHDNGNRTMFECVRQLDDSQWRSFIDQHPKANIYHTPEMFAVFARAENHLPQLYAMVDSRGSLLALFLPVEVSVKDGLLRPLTTRAIAYGSVLCAESAAGERALRQLLAEYQRESSRRALFTELRHVDDATDVQPLLNKAGFQSEGHLNYWIDLREPEDALWKKISKSGRQRIRSAANKGVIVEDVTERETIADAYRLLQDVYTTVQVPLASRTLFEAAFDVLAPENMMKIFLARLDGRPIGVRFLLLHKNRIIDWYAGADREFLSFSPNEVLVWHALTWGQSHGYELFDFGGAGKPDEEYGPRVFKSKFGGELLDLGRDVYVHSPLRLKVSTLGYQVARRFL